MKKLNTLIIAQVLLLILIFVSCSEDTPDPVVPVYETGIIFEGHDDYPQCHGSTILALENGDVLSAWYAGAYEKALDVAIFLSRLPKGESEWTTEELVADTPDLSEGNPVLFQAPDGVIWLWYLTIAYPDLGWSGCQIKLIKSSDNGYTWSDTEIFREDLGINTRNHPIVLENGDWILPLAEEFFGLHSYFYKSTDSGQTWITDITAYNPTSDQPTVFQKDDGTLVAYMRNPEADYLLKSVSDDNGDSWSNPADTEFFNPDSAAEVIKLNSGNIVLALNNTNKDWTTRTRSELSLLYSTDEGESWINELMLEKEAGSNFGYPSLSQGPDSNIYISYTNDNLRIKYIILNELYLNQQ